MLRRVGLVLRHLNALVHLQPQQYGTMASKLASPSSSTSPPITSPPNPNSTSETTLSRMQPEVIPRKMQSARLFILNRPSQLNALSLNMVNIMKPQLQAWKESDLCKVIVLMSDAESKAFCAGGDVKNIVTQARSQDPDEIAKSMRFFEQEYALNHLLGTLKKPVVAIMNGITMGGGVGLSVHAPFRIATEKTVFAMPETKIGLFPDVGGSFFLPRLDGEIGTYLGLTGKVLKGNDIFMAGIATHYIPSGRIPSLVARLAELESDEVEVVNMAIEEFVADPPTLKQWKEWTLGGEIRDSIDRCFKHNTIEQIVSALEAENTDWAKETLSALKKYSPTSLKTTLMQLRFGRNMSFAECFKMEYRMVQAFLRHPDFFEGVDAHLINKTGNPRWNPSWEKMTTELPNQLVERLFFGIGNSRASSAMSSSNNNNSAPSVSTADSPKQELELMNQFTYYDYPHRPLSNLPTDRDVKRVVEGTGMRGRVITVPTSKKDVLDWLLTNWGGYDSGVIGQNEPPRSITIEGGFGRGKFGLKEKVECILDRHVQENASSLRWINPTNK